MISDNVHFMESSYNCTLVMISRELTPRVHFYSTRKLCNHLWRTKLFLVFSIKVRSLWSRRITPFKLCLKYTYCSFPSRHLRFVTIRKQFLGICHTYDTYIIQERRAMLNNRLELITRVVVLLIINANIWTLNSTEARLTSRYMWCFIYVILDYSLFLCCSNI